MGLTGFTLLFQVLSSLAVLFWINSKILPASLRFQVWHNKPASFIDGFWQQQDVSYKTTEVLLFVTTWWWCWAPAGFQEGLRSEGGDLGSSTQRLCEWRMGAAISLVFVPPSLLPAHPGWVAANVLTTAICVSSYTTITWLRSSWSLQQVHLCSQGAWATENEWQNIRHLVWIISASVSTWKTRKCNVPQHRQQEAARLQSSRRPLPLEDRAMQQAALPPETAELRPVQETPANIEWNPRYGCSQQELIFNHTPAVGHTGLIGMVWMWIPSIRGGGTAFGPCCPVLPVCRRSNWGCWVWRWLGTRPSLEFIRSFVCLFIYFTASKVNSSSPRPV